MITEKIIRLWDAPQKYLPFLDDSGLACLQLATIFKVNKSGHNN